MTTLLKKARNIVLAGAVAATTAAGMAAPAYAQGGRGGLNSMEGWTVLGARVVSDRVENDRIRVRDRERYSEVKFCVLGGPVRLRFIEVEFGNGRVQELDVRRRYRANSCTRAVDLRGRRGRFIDEIRMRYDARRNRGRQPVAIVLAR